MSSPSPNLAKMCTYIHTSTYISHPSHIDNRKRWVVAIMAMDGRRAHTLAILQSIEVQQKRWREEDEEDEEDGEDKRYAMTMEEDLEEGKLFKRRRNTGW